MKLACGKRLDAQAKQPSSQPAHVAEHFEQCESTFYAFMAKTLVDHIKSYVS